MPGEAPPRRSELVSLGFWAMLINGTPARLNSWLVVPGCVGMAGAFALFEWAKRSIRGQYFSVRVQRRRPGDAVDRRPVCLYPESVLCELSAGDGIRGVDDAHHDQILVFAGTVMLLTSAARHEERKFARSPLAGE